MPGNLFVVVAPSGAGKTSLVHKLLEKEPNVHLSISYTTRAPREGEADGRDYHFLTREEFDGRIEREAFLEFATYSGNRYGTLRSEVRKRLDAGHSVVLEIEVQGARQVRAAMRESVQVFIAPPDPAVLRQRLESRGADSAAAIEARLDVARQELAAQDEFAYRVVNDDLRRAAGDLEGIVRAELGLPLDSAAE